MQVFPFRKQANTCFWFFVLNNSSSPTITVVHLLNKLVELTLSCNQGFEVTNNHEDMMFIYLLLS